MKYLNLLFHIYQPPVQTLDVLGRIVRESYEPLSRVIRSYPSLRFTMNVNFSLIQLLYDHYPEILDNIRCAHDHQTLELTATGAYHPIFPLIPPQEVEEQIRLNTTGTRSRLSDSYKPQGIFSPELAFTGSLVPLYRRLGFKWTIADDGTLTYYGIDVPFNKIYSFNGLAVFLRSNHWTNRFADYRGQWPRGSDCVTDILASLRSWIGDGDGYLIIALDGETFGHHQPRLNERFLVEMFDALLAASAELQTTHLCTLQERFPMVQQFIPPGTWSTDAVDARTRDYFSWWRSKDNQIHDLQWRLTEVVLEKVRRRGADTELNNEMHEALYSCQYWWASHWKFAPDQIYRGAFNLMRLLQRAANHHDAGGPEEDRDLVRGERIFRRLVTEVERQRHQKRS